MNDISKHLGVFLITTKVNGQITQEEVEFNRITNAGLNALINSLDGIDPNLQIKYLAIGTGTKAIDDTDTTLDNEIFRTQFTSSNNTATGEFTTEFTVLDSEAVATWQEIGIFCGTSATSTADTGTMLSRILFTKVKTSLEEIDVTRIDRISRT